MAISDRFLITCEHGGNVVPQAYRDHFTGLDALLASHRGWDPGAFILGREMADALSAPFFSSLVTRLLVDLNRSLGHPQLHFPTIGELAETQRQEIIARYYTPHRTTILMAVDELIAAGHRVIHIASHSFTPELDGMVRTADVAWLYDPRRSGECGFAQHWRNALHISRPDLRLRRNYPYAGKNDGLTATLRKRHDDAHYVGIELEVNQQFFFEGGPPWNQLRAAIVKTLQALRNIR